MTMIPKLASIRWRQMNECLAPKVIGNAHFSIKSTHSINDRHVLDVQTAESSYRDPSRYFS